MHLRSLLRGQLFVSVASLLFGALQSIETRAQAFPSWRQEGGDAGADNYVDVALNADLFRFSWRAPTWSEYPGNTHYKWDIATDGSHVYRTVIDGFNPFADYQVMSLDMLTGVEEWRTTIKGYSWDGVGAPTVVDGAVFVNRLGHTGSSAPLIEHDYPKLYRLDAITGAVQAATRYEGQYCCNDRPTVVNGHVLAGGGYFGGLNLFGVNGQRKWFFEDVGAHQTTLVAGDEVFLGNGKVVSLSSGQLLRTIKHPSGEILRFSALSEERNLYGFSLNSTNQPVVSEYTPLTNALLTDYLLPPPSWLSLAVGGGKLAVSTFNNGVYLYHLGEPQPYAHWDPGALLTGNVVMTKSHLFALTTSPSGREGTIYALDLATNKPVWSMPVRTGALAVGDGYLFLNNEFETIAISLTIPEPSSIALSMMCSLAILTMRPHTTRIRPRLSLVSQ
jgi:outer membrane protein assembly factor BamB